MAVTAKIDPKDEAYIKNMLERAERKSVKFANRAVKNIALRFFISARKWTGPDRATKIAKMRKKNRVRRVVSMSLSKQAAIGEYWYKDLRKNRIFKSDRYISPKSRRRNRIQGRLASMGAELPGQENGRLLHLTRGIKAWNKKKKRYVLHGTTLSAGLHEGIRKNRSTAPVSTRIPGAGAAKAGWIQGMKNLGHKKGTKIGRITPRVGTTRWNKGPNPIIRHRNEVDYVSNISRGVVSKSMSKAVNWLKAKERKKFNKMVRSEYKKTK
jgi:hypothetical protein